MSTFVPEEFFANDPEGLAWFYRMQELHKLVRAELLARFGPEEYATHVLRSGNCVMMIAPDGSAREVELQHVNLLEWKVVTLDEAWAKAEAAIDFPQDHPLYRHGTWRLSLQGPWDIEVNADRPTYEAVAEPYNATGHGNNRAIAAVGGTAAEALMALVEAIRRKA